MNKYGLGWDEGADLESAAAVVHWALRLPLRSLSESFSSAAIMEGWGDDPQHGSITRIVHAAGWLAFYRFSDDTWFQGVTAYRIGTIVAFGLLAALIFFIAARLGGIEAGVCATAVLIGMPRVFAHAHICATDIIASLFFLSAAAAGWKSLRSTKWTAVFAVLFVAAFLAKETGWLLAPMYALLLAAIRPHGWPKRILIFTCVFIAVFFILQPVYWINMFENLQRYINYLALGTRKVQSSWSYYFFQRYEYSPPWHYPFFMLGVTMTIPALIIVIFGYVNAVVKRDAKVLWFTLPGLLIPAFFALPQIPVYDCERLLLPGMAFLAISAGLAVAAMISRLNPLMKKAIVVSLALMFTIMLLQTHPREGVFYNSLIGGPKGALARGMDLDYWGTGVNRDFIEKINNALPPNATMKVIGYNIDNLWMYQDFGIMRKDIRLTGYDEPADAIIIGSRPGVFDKFAILFFYSAHPVIETRWRGALLTGFYILRY